MPRRYRTAQAEECGGPLWPSVAPVGTARDGPEGFTPLSIDTMLMQDNFPGRCRPHRSCIPVTRYHLRLLTWTARSTSGIRTGSREPDTICFLLYELFDIGDCQPGMASDITKGCTSNFTCSCLNCSCLPTRLLMLTVCCLDKATLSCPWRQGWGLWAIGACETRSRPKSPALTSAHAPTHACD